MEKLFLFLFFNLEIKAFGQQHEHFDKVLAFISVLVIYACILVLDKVLVWLLNVNITQNAHCLGNAESHPEVSFFELPETLLLHKVCQLKICTIWNDATYSVFSKPSSNFCFEHWVLDDVRRTTMLRIFWVTGQKYFWNV